MTRAKSVRATHLLRLGSSFSRRKDAFATTCCPLVPPALISRWRQNGSAGHERLGAVSFWVRYVGGGGGVSFVLLFFGYPFWVCLDGIPT